MKQQQAITEQRIQQQNILKNMKLSTNTSIDCEVNRSKSKEGGTKEKDGQNKGLVKKSI